MLRSNKKAEACFYIFVYGNLNYCISLPSTPQDQDLSGMEIIYINTQNKSKNRVQKLFEGLLKMTELPQ